MSALVLFYHYVWTANPWHLLAAGYASGCVVMFAVIWLLRRKA